MTIERDEETSIHLICPKRLQVCYVSSYMTLDVMKVIYCCSFEPSKNMADGTIDSDGLNADLCSDKKVSRDRVDFVREEYKRYKRKKPPPDFSEVIDFQDPTSFRGRVEKFEVGGVHSKFGLRCSSEWRAYKLKSCPGLMFIVNPFLPGGQHYWIRRCMEDFPRKPNVCNLDAHMTLDPEKSVWEISNRYT